MTDHEIDRTMDRLVPSAAFDPRPGPLTWHDYVKMVLSFATVSAGFYLLKLIYPYLFGAAAYLVLWVGVI